MELIKNDILLEIKHLNVQFPSDGKLVYAVNDVSLSLSRGITLGLVGETGAGKTTIAKSILRILPKTAKVAGSIKFDGTELIELPEKKIKKIRGNKISMIFQDPMTALNPTIKIGNQIAEAISLHEKCSQAEAEKKACDMLEMVGISSERFSEYPHQFSGGMKQRVVIAIALACNPELLLADEPTTALDVTIQAQVLDMMSRLKKKLNTSLIMITHDLGIVAETCDQVAVVYAGEIVEYGTVEDIFENAYHPYTEGLFGSLPSLSDSTSRLKPISGVMPDPTDLPKGCNFSARCPYAIEQCKCVQPQNVYLNNSHFVKCIKVEAMR